MSGVNGQNVVNKFQKMSEADLCGETFFHLGKKEDEVTNVEPVLSKQPLSAKLEEEFSWKRNPSEYSSNYTGHWCEAVSSSISNITGKQAWKNGTGKISQTFNNVRTTFGVLSQRIKKSTKKRQALVNVESPSAPATPSSKSRAALGRTPTKLYSPFSIDTPRGKENQLNKFIKDQTHSDSSNGKEGKKKFRRTKLDLGVNIGETINNIGEAVLSNDLLQTQIGIYEFHSVANKIVQRSFNN